MHETDGPSIEQRERYREWMNRSVGVGTLGFFVAVAASIVAPDPISDWVLFAGLGAYYLGYVGYLVVWQRTGVRHFDEREAEIERRAASITALFITTVTVFGLPAVVVLETTGVADVPAFVQGVVWGYFALVLVFLGVYWYVERQYS